MESIATTDPVPLHEVLGDRYEAGVEVYAVFARGALLSNPLWLPDTVAIDGHSAEEGPVRVIVRTARRDELVATLREGVAARLPSPEGRGRATG